MAEAYCRGDSLERFFKYMSLSLNEKEEERYKIREFKNYINLYENYNYLFTKNKNLEIFYNYCKNYVIKNDKIQELYIKFKEKKLNIPEQSLKLDLKKLNEYIRENGRVTIYSKITDFNYITVIPKNLWKYYYLSEITREPLFFYNLKNDLFEKIEDLFIEN